MLAVRYTTQYEDAGLISCPVIVCDFCDRIIPTAREGTTLWYLDRAVARFTEGAPMRMFHAHKTTGCVAALDATFDKQRYTYLSGELEDVPHQLLLSLVVDLDTRLGGKGDVRKLLTMLRKDVRALVAKRGRV